MKQSIVLITSTVLFCACQIAATYPLGSEGVSPHEDSLLESESGHGWPNSFNVNALLRRYYNSDPSSLEPEEQDEPEPVNLNRLLRSVYEDDYYHHGPEASPRFFYGAEAEEPAVRSGHDDMYAAESQEVDYSHHGGEIEDAEVEDGEYQ